MRIQGYGRVHWQFAARFAELGFAGMALHEIFKLFKFEHDKVAVSFNNSERILVIVGFEPISEVTLGKIGAIFAEAESLKLNIRGLRKIFSDKEYATVPMPGVLTGEWKEFKKKINKA